MTGLLVWLIQFVGGLLVKQLIFDCLGSVVFLQSRVLLLGVVSKESVELVVWEEREDLSFWQRSLRSVGGTSGSQIISLPDKKYLLTSINYYSKIKWTCVQSFLYFEHTIIYACVQMNYPLFYLS